MPAVNVAPLNVVSEYQAPSVCRSMSAVAVRLLPFHRLSLALPLIDDPLLWVPLPMLTACPQALSGAKHLCLYCQGVCKLFSTDHNRS